MQLRFNDEYKSWVFITNESSLLLNYSLEINLSIKLSLNKIFKELLTIFWKNLKKDISPYSWGKMGYALKVCSN